VFLGLLATCTKEGEPVPLNLAVGEYTVLDDCGKARVPKGAGERIVRGEPGERSETVRFIAARAFAKWLNFLV
jgi:hypothetical protein